MRCRFRSLCQLARLAIVADWARDETAVESTRWSKNTAARFLSAPVRRSESATTAGKTTLLARSAKQSAAAWGLVRRWIDFVDFFLGNRLDDRSLLIGR